MCVVIDINQIITFDDEFESALHSFEWMQRFANYFFTNAQLECYQHSGNGIFHVMKTRDTELNFFDLRSKAVKIKFKKSAIGGYVAGKKLSPAHTIRFFRNGYSFCERFNRLMYNQTSVCVDLLHEIAERGEHARVISVNIQMVRICWSHHRYLRKQSQKWTIELISLYNHQSLYVYFSVHY